MCHLHSIKVPAAYEKFSFAERAVINEAWYAARKNADVSPDALVLGFAIESGARIFSSVGSACDVRSVESQALKAGLAAGVSSVSRVVIVSKEGYWPSRQLVDELLMHAPPETEVLMVNHINGQTKRWLLSQLNMCDRTVEHVAALRARETEEFEGNGDA